MMKRICSMAVFALLASLSACSNSSAPPAASQSAGQNAAPIAASSASAANLPPLDPCKLATAAEASEAAGGKVGAGKEIMNAGRKDCQFKSSNSMRVIGINIMHPSDLALFAPGSLKPIPGIADHAYFDPGIHAIWIEKGQRVVSITIEVPSPKNPYAPLPIASLTPAAKKFAKLVASRM